MKWEKYGWKHHTLLLKTTLKIDRASRIINTDIEWELSQLAFDQIEKSFGPFSVDLFASRLNTKCKRFFSRFPDPEAEAVDDFTKSWKHESFYVFPPFALILRTLRKLINENAIGVVIVPSWPIQPYPLFMSLLVEPSIRFRPNISILMSPCRKKIHPLASQLSLMAGKLSNKPSC